MEKKLTYFFSDNSVFFASESISCSSFVFKEQNKKQCVLLSVDY